MTALWLDHDAPHALALARSNLQLQREPLDWWVVVQSARQAEDPRALDDIASAIHTAGLNDLRLTSLLAATKARNAKMAK